MVLYQILSYTTHGKYEKVIQKHWIQNIWPNVEYKIWITCWIILCIGYSRSFWVYHQKTWNNTGNTPVRLYVNKIEKRIIFKIWKRVLSSIFNSWNNELLGSTKSKRTKDENGENSPNIEISEVVLVHCNTVNNDYQHDSRFLYTFFPKKSFSQLLDILYINLIFKKTKLN